MIAVETIGKCWQDYNEQTVCQCAKCQTIALSAFTAGFYAFVWNLDVLQRRENTTTEDVAKFIEQNLADYRRLCDECCEISKRQRGAMCN